MFRHSAPNFITRPILHRRANIVTVVETVSLKELNMAVLFKFCVFL